MPELRSDIPEIIIIPSTCRETHLDIFSHWGWPLRDREIRGGGLSELFAPYQIKRSRPATHLVMYTLEGEGVAESSSGVVKLTPGLVWVSPAMIPQNYRSSSHWRCFWFHLVDSDQWSSLRKPQSYLVAAQNLPLMTSAIESYLSESWAGLHGSHELVEAYSHTIGVYLERDIVQAEDPSGNRIRHLMSLLWNTVDSDLCRNWEAQDLADALHISVATLNRTVKKFYGKTPMEMVTAIRMRRAEHLLISSPYTLEQIAGMLGYATAFSFSRAFKSHSGLAPRDFRQADPLIEK